MAYEARARLGAKLAEITPGDIDKFFFTLGGAEANENAIQIARPFTGPPEDPRALSLVSRRHGGAIDADRRPAALGQRAGIPGVVHVLDPYHGTAADRRATAAAGARATSRDHPARGPGTIAAFILETVTGTNGILIPPDGYLQGVRELCDRTAS